MRENELRRLMKAAYSVIVRIPNYRRKEMEKENIFVPEYIDGKIIELLVTGGRKQCSVVIRDGMGRDIKVLAGSVIRFKGRGDEDGSRFNRRSVRRKKKRVSRREQMRMFQ